MEPDTEPYIKTCMEGIYSRTPVNPLCQVKMECKLKLNSPMLPRWVAGECSNRVGLQSLSVCVWMGGPAPTEGSAQPHNTGVLDGTYNIALSSIVGYCLVKSYISSLIEDTSSVLPDWCTVQGLRTTHHSEQKTLWWNDWDVYRKLSESSFLQQILWPGWSF